MTNTKNESRQYRIRSGKGGYNTGSAKSFVIEVYAPAPFTMPWKSTGEIFGTYTAAAARTEELRCR